MKYWEISLRRPNGETSIIIVASYTQESAEKTAQRWADGEFGVGSHLLTLDELENRPDRVVKVLQ